MNNIMSTVARTPARLTEATVALSPEEVDIIIEALTRFRASNWRTETRSVANKAESLRDRLLTVRDVG